MSHDCDYQVLCVNYISCKNMAACAYFHIFSLTAQTAKKARRRHGEESEETQSYATKIIIQDKCTSDG